MPEERHRVTKECQAAGFRQQYSKLVRILVVIHNPFDLTPIGICLGSKVLAPDMRVVGFNADALFWWQEIFELAIP